MVCNFNGMSSTVGTSISYCKSWFWDQKRPTELWSDQQARTAHDARTLYGVIIGPVNKPSHIVEVTKKPTPKRLVTTVCKWPAA